MCSTYSVFSEMSDKEPNLCFLNESIHKTSVCKYKDQSEHLIRLNNYDHVTAVVFEKLKRSINDPSLSRFKKPTPKICLACCKYLGDSLDNNNFPEKASSVASKTESSQSENASFDKLLLQIKTLPMSENQLNKLMHAIGERLAPITSNHVAQLNKTSLSNRLESMESMTYQSYWQNAFGPLKNILSGLVNSASKRTETEEIKNSRIRLVIHAIETIFAAINLNYTSASVLAEMLYMYFLSNSRRVCEIYGTATGGGTSTTLQNALQRISKIPPVFPEDGYVVVAFDNNQVMAKAHRVELDCKFKISVVTSLAVFELLNVENPQNEVMNFPLLYQISPNDAAALNEKLHQFTSSSLKLVNQYLMEFLGRRLIYIESSMSENAKDYVDDTTKAPPKGNNGLPYEDILAYPSSCKIYDQECLLVNPNSYHTVRDVLLHIQKMALNEKRKWVTIVVDGIPFTLAQELIRKSVYCHICDEILMEKDVPSHYSVTHCQPSPSQLKRVFDNILLRPGAGHYEMNMVKALFSGWFPLYLEPVAELLGFHTPKAKWCIQNCTDHHKAWQLLEITFESLSDELLHSYVAMCQKSTPPLKPTVEGFLEQVSRSNNENAKAAFQFAYYWCFSILLFRGGIRNNNFDVAIKAREQGAGLFYAFRHPKYQLINCLDVSELIQMPTNVRKTVHRESMVIPGSKVGQGVDFLLEQRNKRMKNFVIRNGVPTSEQWKAASASMQKLDKIIESVEHRLNLQTSSSQSKLDHSLEKQAARSLFRRHGIVELTKKMEISFVPGIQHTTKPFNSILRCQLLAESNRKNFYEGIIKTGQATVGSYISLFKGDNEEEEVNQWGITKLRSETKIIAKFLSKDVQREVNLELKSSDKEKLREIYWRVYSLVDNDDEDD